MRDVFDNGIDDSKDNNPLLQNYQPSWKIDQVPTSDGAGVVDVLRSADAFQAITAFGARFHEGFEACYHRLGNAASTQIAVDYGHEQVTYAALFNRANQLAWYFKQLDITAGARIALLLDRSLDSYAAVLAASKIGAAYVPLDASFPRDRILFMLEDSEVQVVLTLSKFTNIFEGASSQIVAMEDSLHAIDACPTDYFETVTTQAEPDPLAYLIYTSGSTGKPKGVPIRHASIANFMDVATRLYGYEQSDRVYQGLTIAFDFSFEEVWIPLFTGATLVPAPADVKLVGSDLTEYLAEHAVTALCCTPTMLSTLDDDLPKLRFMLLSGEACPADVVAPWLSPARRILNVYGPTETTVTATWAVVEKDKPITIGGPLPTYDIVVVNPDTQQAVKQGETGEVCIAGVGLCDDYLNRPEKTAQAFMPDFVGLPNNPSKRLYRTGDLGRINDANEIEYLGRIDTQVKIRGYRIELEEIESVARGVAGIEQAVVQPFDIDGNKTLVAFLTPESPDTELDVASVFETLKTALPSYMVPAYFEQLNEVPVLPSGKTNRNALTAPTGPKFVAASEVEMVAPRTPLETELARLLASILKLDAISVVANFFEDLGADSLTMAAFVTAVRNEMGIKQLSMRHLYAHATIADVAESLVALQAIEQASAQAEPSAYDLHKDNPHIPSYLARYTMGFAQIGVYLSQVFLFTWLSLSLFYWVLEAETFAPMLLRAVSSTTALFVMTAVVFILAKWVAIGRFTTTPIKVWSFQHFRFWIAENAVKFNPLNAFIGTPVYNAYLRLLGAKIGRNAISLSPSIVCTDLVSIGDNTVIRQHVYLAGYTTANGYIYPGHIDVGADVVVCEDTVLDINTKIGDKVQIGLVSAVQQGQTIPNDTVYQGVPAEPSKSNFDRLPTFEISNWRKGLYIVFVFAYSTLTNATFALIGTMLYLYAVANGYINMDNLLLVSVGLFFAGLVLGMLYIYIVPRIVNLFVQPEKAHPRYGLQFELARWMNAATNSKYFNRLFGDSALILHWLSIVGYDLRKATQTGSNFGIEQAHNNPFLCEFDRDTMVADGLNLLNTEASTTAFIVRKIKVPAETYFGNSLFYPGYANLGENCLIGTKTAIPVDEAVKENTGLVGSPAFEIPRHVSRDTQFDHYKAPGVLEKHLAAKLRYNLSTIAIFLLRDLLLATASFSTLMFVLSWGGTDHLLGDVTMTAIKLSIALPVIYMMVLLGTILSERLVYKFKPIAPEYCSIYDQTFWQHERFWKLAADDMIKAFDGTPFKSWVLRLQGVKVGKGLYDNGCGFSEPSMVSIADHCTLNATAYVQCHSLENGALKSDCVSIGSYCTLASNSFIQYGAVLEDQTYLDVNANLMKGSIMESGTVWLGNPAREALK